ncbi:MAG: hypothetical protein HONBIEJF_02052 [Fimbriimonadaceae bacterium]|nr:hypothetical protein [Fimbriimonadaceae bacterium]
MFRSVFAGVLGCLAVGSSAFQYTQQQLDTRTDIGQAKMAYAFAVNARNWVVGYWLSPDNEYFGFIWDNKKHFDWIGGDPMHCMVLLRNTYNGSFLNSYATALNNGMSPCVITGALVDTGGRHRAAIWRTDDLDHPSVWTLPPLSYESVGFGINDGVGPNLVVVGRGKPAPGGNNFGFYWRTSGMTVLPGFGGGATTSETFARDVNNGASPLVVGYADRTFLGETATRAFAWRQGEPNLTPLHLPGGFLKSWAYSANDAGDIAGGLEGGGGGLRACVWPNGQSEAVVLPPYPGQAGSVAYGISSGDTAVVGAVVLYGESYGAIWNDLVSPPILVSQAPIGGYPRRIAALYGVTDTLRDSIATCGIGEFGPNAQAVLVRAHASLGGGRTGKAIGSVSFQTTGSSDLDLPAGGSGDAKIDLSYNGQADEQGRQRTQQLSISEGGTLSTNEVAIAKDESSSSLFTVSANPGSEGKLLTVSFTIDEQSGDYGYQRSFGRVRVHNPVPVIDSVVPNVLDQSSEGATVVLHGSGYVSEGAGDWSDSQVLINSHWRPSVWVSPTEISVNLMPGDLAVPGTVMLEVLNVGPGGGRSGIALVRVEPLVDQAALVGYSVGPQGQEKSAHDPELLRVNDGNRSFAENTAVANFNIPGIRYNVQFDSAITERVDSVEVVVDAQTQFPNIEQRLSLLDRTDMTTLRRLDTFVFTTGNTDVTRSGSVSPAADYVGPNGEVTAVVQYRRVGLLPSQRFQGRIDQVGVTVTK